MKALKDKFFIDTNILVYSFDSTNLNKKEAAQDLINKALSSGQGSISFQVVQEFLNVAVRKFQTPLKTTDAQIYLGIVLRPLCKVYSSISLYNNALEISDRYKYSFYDSLIISAGLESKSRYLFSEDLQHSQKIEGLEIVNPFKN